MLSCSSLEFVQVVALCNAASGWLVKRLIEQQLATQPATTSSTQQWHWL
jgi:hypothetical protein